MSAFRELGRLAGKAAGTLIGGAVNVVGELADSRFLKEVGNGVKKASEFAGDTFGQASRRRVEYGFRPYPKGRGED